MTDDERRALVGRAKSDRRVNDGVGIVVRADRAFESAIVADRLAMMAAFHEARWCGVELASFREATAREKREPDHREMPEVRIRNDAISDAHVTALESRRKTAAAALLTTLDHLLDALWARLGLPEWSVRGGPVIAGDVTAFELVHLCGNYLRHVHQWLAGGAGEPRAQRNVERLRAAGFDYRDEAMLAAVVDALPYGNFTDLEVAALDFVEFMAWFTQERMLARWAAENGEPRYHVRFNPYDDGNGHRELAMKLDSEVGTQWKFPP